MALFNCSECGYEFSDKAPACPKCGCPNAPGGVTPIGPPPQQKKPKKKVTTLQAFLILLGIGLPGIFVYSLGRNLIEVHLCNAEVSSGCESILSRRGDTDAEEPLWSQEKDGFWIIPAVTNQKFWEKANKLEKERAEKQAAKSKKKTSVAWLLLCEQAIKESLKDPWSYRKIKTYWTDKAVEFSAKNSFGGRQRYVADCKTGKILQR